MDTVRAFLEHKPSQGHQIFLRRLWIMGRRFVSGKKTLLVVLAIALMLLAVMPEASATRRILLVGDSWAQWPWNMGAFQAVLK